MSIIEKIIKVLEAKKEVVWGIMKHYEALGNKELEERAFGEWLGVKTALDMLTDEARTEAYYNIWFGEEEEK